MIKAGIRKRNVHLLLILLTGGLLSQCIASLHVYFANTALQQKMMALHAAGYLIVPNSIVTATLKTIKPAIYGGLFFTLTVGAALTLASFAAAWIWVRIFNQHRMVAGILCLLWVGLLIANNSQGIAPFASTYLVLIPVVVSGLSIRWLVSGIRTKTRIAPIAFLLPILVLAVLWTTLWDRHLFINLRDQLLLSNPIGININDFYYKYTLYPSETFKSLEQKQLKTWVFEQRDDSHNSQELLNILLNQDYLFAPGVAKADLKIAQEGGALILTQGETSVYQLAKQTFLADPVSALRIFSQRTDLHGFFRSVIYFSLLLGFPIFLYAILYVSLSILFSWGSSPGVPAVLAALVCLVAGIALFFPVKSQPHTPFTPETVATALASNTRPDQLAALRYILSKQLEIADFPVYEKLTTSPHVTVRYYLARALGKSHNAGTYRPLLDLLQDPHPNVVCQALAAVGQRGERRIIPQIVTKIKNSDHWYVQWYAYRALRTLGWKQKQSP